MGNPVDLNRLMWLALGAGSKGAVAGMVSGFVGEEEVGITPDIATAFIGFFIAQQGGERIGAFGEGMLIASVGQIVRKPIEKLFERFKPEEEEKPKTTVTQGATGGGGSLPAEDAYILAKYGISLS
ncbi:hypothetical protein ES703_13909 [subsurface metagenome]